MQDFIVTYLANNFILLAMLVSMTVCLFLFPSDDGRMIHLFRVLIPTIFGGSIMDWVDRWIAENMTTFTWWRTIASFCGYTWKIVAIAIVILLFVKGKKWQFAIGIPAIINTLVYTTMFYTKWNTWFDENNGFHGGPLRYSFIIFAAYYAGVFVYATFRTLREKKSKEAVFLIPVSLIIVSAVLIEAETDIKNATSTAIALSLLIFYLSLYIVPTKYDVVTGLFNRRIYMMDINKNKNLKAVISLDINYLKEINDTLGHEEGDHALNVTGRVIAINSDAIAKESGMNIKCYRVGGDEFAILWFGDKPADIALIDKLIRYMQDSCKVYGYSVAAGFAIVEDPKDYHETIRKADAKMYENKGYMKILEEYHVPGK